MSTDTDNVNHEFLRKLGQLNHSELDTLTESQKLEKNVKQALSQPNNVAGQGYLGAMPVNKVLQGDFRSDGEVKQSLPTHEPETDVKPTENEQFYREANGLDYPIYPNTGIVTRRSDEQYFPEIDNYVSTHGNQPLIEIKLKVNYGQYICAKNSYLKLRITPNSNDVNFATGSACNIIKRARYVLANGEVIDNCDKVNIYNHVRDHWSRGTDYVNNYGITKGYQSNSGAMLVENNLIIPLGDLLPIFNVESLLPPEMVSSCTITLELEKPIIAFETFQATTVLFGDFSYTVSNISVILDSYYLDPSFVKIMHQKEIIVEYPTYETLVNHSKNKNPHFDLEISKTRVLNVICRPLNNAVDFLNYSIDSIKGQSNLFADKKEQYWTVNNQNYPEYKRDKYDEYIYNYKTFGANITEPLIRPSNLEAFGDHFIETLNLERSKYNIEGQPITNKNLIRYHRTSFTSNDVNFVFFVTYMKRVHVSPLSPNRDARLQFPKYDITE